MNISEKYLLFFYLLFLNLSSNAQIPFADFSNWSQDSLGYMDPDGWESSNLTDGRETIFTDTDRVGGTGYSAKFVTLYDTLGLSYHGHLRLANQAFTGTSRPTALSGYWKISATNFNHIFDVSIKLYNSSGTEVGRGSKSTPGGGNLLSWTPFNVNITYSSSDPVATYLIDVYLITLITSPTLVAHIDDLSFDFSTDINSLDKHDIDVNIKRQEEQYILEIEKTSFSNLQVEIVDIHGKVVARLADGDYPAGINGLTFNLTSQLAGIYFCRIITEGKSEVLKVLR
ncbi:MAG: T9SS type A sorting domain-containing protein [Bacteroidetes bacterium]|nr:MAG: T9SS type A sorting domain-containing protein [Bacteroidota bacterium]